MLEMPDSIGCRKVLNLMVGILKARGVIYRMIIIITIMQKPEAIIFVVGVVLLTLTSAKRTKSKKTNKLKTFNLLEIFQRLSPIAHSKRYTQTNLTLEDLKPSNSLNISIRIVKTTHFSATRVITVLSAK